MQSGNRGLIASLSWFSVKSTRRCLHYRTSWVSIATLSLIFIGFLAAASGALASSTDSRVISKLPAKSSSLALKFVSLVWARKPTPRRSTSSALASHLSASHFDLPRFRYTTTPTNHKLKVTTDSTPPRAYSFHHLPCTTSSSCNPPCCIITHPPPWLRG